LLLYLPAYFNWTSMLCVYNPAELC
jgi:hypothetical protein